MVWIIEVLLYNAIWRLPITCNLLYKYCKTSILLSEPVNLDNLGVKIIEGIFSFI